MTPDFPKISIIMPTLNVKDYIEECIDSVVNQTLKDIEIIVVDAGSNDGTLDILKEYEKKDPRITLLHSDKKSYGYQMNMAISKAKGEYIGIVETDDYIAPEMYEELYNLSNNGEYDLIKSSFIHVNEDTNEIFKNTNKLKQQIPNDKPFNLKDNANILMGHPSIWAGIYKRDLILNNEIKFMEEPGGGWVDNPFFHETACLAKTIMYTDKAYYYYRESNPNSSSNSLDDYSLPIIRMMDNLDVLDKYHECKTEDVLKIVYSRVNAYMNNIQRRDKFSENEPMLRPYIRKMMKRLEEPIVLKYFSMDEIKRYYFYLVPFNFFKEEDEKKIPSEEFSEIVRERDFHLSAINHYQNEIKKLKIQNKKLKQQNKKLKKKNKDLKESLKVNN